MIFYQKKSEYIRTKRHAAIANLLKLATVSMMLGKVQSIAIYSPTDDNLLKVIRADVHPSQKIDYTYRTFIVVAYKTSGDIYHAIMLV